MKPKNSNPPAPDMREIIDQTLSEMDINLTDPENSFPRTAMAVIKNQQPMKLNTDRNYNFEVIRDLFETSLYHVIISEKGAFIDQRVLTVKATNPFDAINMAVAELKRKSKKV